MKVKLTLRPRRRGADGHRRHRGLDGHGRGRRSPHRRVGPERDPCRSRAGDVVTLAVAPPDGSDLEPLEPSVHIGEAPIGSGFCGRVVTHGKRPAADAAGYATRRNVGTLVATDGPLRGQEFPLNVGHATIGRAPTNHIVLADPMVSKLHARHRGRQPDRAGRPQLRQRRDRRRHRGPARPAGPQPAGRDRRIDAGAAPRRQRLRRAARCSSAEAACTSTAVPASTCATRAPRTRRPGCPRSRPGGSSRGRSWWRRSSWRWPSTRSPAASARCC